MDKKWTDIIEQLDKDIEAKRPRGILATTNLALELKTMGRLTLETLRLGENICFCHHMLDKKVFVTIFDELANAKSYMLPPVCEF